MSYTSILAALVLSLTSFTLAADLPGGAEVVLDQKALAGAGHKIVPVDGAPFTSAIEVDVPAATPEPWDVQVAATSPVAIKSGDVLHIRMYVRNLESMTGQANFGVVFELNQAPHTKSTEGQYNAGSEWTEIDIPFVARQDYQPNGAQLGIRLGYAKQRVQIGGVQVLNYRDQVKIADLPRVRRDYAGRSPDAPWRKDAMQRIEQLRKSDMVVRVLDAGGQPVQGAKVSATLKRHAFGFGTAISMRLLEESPDGEKYRQTVKELFSAAVLENELKWQNIAGHKYVRSDALVQWLNENDIPLRGHVLVWPGRQYLPRQIVDLPPAEMKSEIERHITQTVTRYKGKLVDWDVINEPFTNHYVMDQLGKEVMVDWFKLARAADPDVDLYLNDYSILASGNMLDTSHQRHFYETIKYLMDNGAPIDGIGMQGHFGMSVTEPENLLKILDRYAAFGLKIKVTELDMNMDDEQLRADYMRDFHIALFSHPAVEGIIQWGFWEGAHWIGNAALFARDWTIRPHGQAYIDLVHKEWSTKATGLTTDAQGHASFRGFHGVYEVVVTDAGGKATAYPAKLERGASEVVVRLP